MNFLLIKHTILSLFCSSSIKNNIVELTAINEPFKIKKLVNIIKKFKNSSHPDKISNMIYWSLTYLENRIE